MTNGNGPPNAATSVPDVDNPSANDNIRRFAPQSRPMSPPPNHTLFHNKTRCFVL